jgi:hypothetical protein
MCVYCSTYQLTFLSACTTSQIIFLYVSLYRLPAFICNIQPTYLLTFASYYNIQPAPYITVLMFNLLAYIHVFLYSLTSFIIVLLTFVSYFNTYCLICVYYSIILSAYIVQDTSWQLYLTVWSASLHLQLTVLLTVLHLCVPVRTISLQWHLTLSYNIPAYIYPTAQPTILHSCLSLYNLPALTVQSNSLLLSPALQFNT